MTILCNCTVVMAEDRDCAQVFVMNQCGFKVPYMDYPMQPRTKHIVVLCSADFHKDKYQQNSNDRAGRVRLLERSGPTTKKLRGRLHT